MAQTYCIPEGTNRWQYISDFSTTGGIENISNHNSGFSEGGYGDFTNLVVEQEIGSEIEFSVSYRQPSGFRIWVDWNQDGVFDPINEVVYMSDAISANQTGSF